MPFDPVPVPTYPDVPYAPGVPAVLRAGTFLNPALAVSIAVADITGLGGYAPQQQWGIFTASGQPLFDFDNVAGVEIKHEMAVPTYPIEGGGFSSYNKVQLPYDARMTFTVGGDIERRGAFLSALETALFSLSLYTVVMPEFFYSSGNIVHYDLARHDGKGVGMLIVNVYVQEIRNTATSQFAAPDDNSNQAAGTTSQPVPAITAPKEPSGASPTHDGTVQPVSPAALPSFPDSPVMVG